VAAYPRTGKSPEAMVKILITIMEKTPHGGATIENIQDAYLEVKDAVPTDRTIYRNIRRINELFNPAAFAAGGQQSNQSGNKTKRSRALNPKDLAIRSHRDASGVMRYQYAGKKIISKYEANQALSIVLGLYSQQRSILKGHFEKVIASIMDDVLAKDKKGESFFAEIDDHVHISGHGSADGVKVVRKITEIIRAIDNCKVVKIDYLRTYDGNRRTREVEPYGLVCRHGSWYLYGLCRFNDRMRIYLLDQVQRLEVMENSIFKKPATFTLKKVFGSAWGIMISDDAQKAKVETVRLHVKKGVAERFKAVRFHDSQKLKALPGDEAEVSFEVSGADEMIPWLVSWGGSLEVLEPQWLKEELLAYVQSINEVYGR
jgi:predicted DNA-binding transcriptional regulator YafY